jgi:hypothetical protein
MIYPKEMSNIEQGMSNIEVFFTSAVRYSAVRYSIFMSEPKIWLKLALMGSSPRRSWERRRLAQCHLLLFPPWKGGQTIARGERRTNPW